MALDIKKWLKDDLQFSDAEVEELAAKFAPKTQIIEGGFLRQQDYSAKMNEVGNLQKAVADKDAALAAEAIEWSRLTATEKTANTALRESLNRKEAEALALRQKLETVATDAGLDAAAILAGITAAPAAKKDETVIPPAIDPSKFVSVEQYQGVVAMALNLPAELQQIAEDHYALTGKRIDSRTIVREIEARAHTRGNTKSLDPRAVWEELNNIPVLRETKAKESYDAAIAAAREEGAVAARTEAAIPGGTPAGRHAVVFTARPNNGQSVLQRPQPGQAHNTAVAAFTSGKYRTGAQKSA